MATYCSEAVHAPTFRPPHLSANPMNNADCPQWEDSVNSQWQADRGTNAFCELKNVWNAWSMKSLHRIDSDFFLNCTEVLQYVV
jgi:hypothetical protein